MTTPSEKECGACHVVKPAADFHKKAARPDGLQIKCKDCTATYRKAYHASTVTGDGSGQALPPASDIERAAPGIANGDGLTLEPSRASALLGEGGAPKKEKEHEKATLQTMLDAASDKASRTPKSETTPVAFREVQQSTSLAAREAAPSTSATTTNTAGFADLPHAAILRSKTNPRTHFDEAFLVDLAANIRAHGILQAILVRPLPGSRLQDSLDDWTPGTPRPTHELVAGEQRWRAAGMAGLRTVPAMIRDLTDAQVLELQLVENLKRRDLHAMEEAEGYEKLIEATGLTVDKVAERIGKGRTYVYNSLSLLRLIPEAREAFFAGKLTRSVAELIARHTETLQPAILKDVTAVDHLGEGMSFRRAREHIENTYMLQLGHAPFKTDDELLVPAAGPCTTCPMRSGANPDLFGDFANSDTCTNPPCYNTKKAAHYERITVAASARGQSVIVGKEAREIMPDSNTIRGYSRLDEIAPGEKMRSLRDVLGDDLPATTLIEDPTTHDLIEVVPTADAGRLLRDRKGKGKGKAAAAPAAPPAAPPAPTASDIAHDYENAWRHRAIRHVVDAIGVGVEDDSHSVSREIGLLLVASLQGRGLDTCADLANVGAIARRDGLAEHVRTVPLDALWKWLVVLMMAHDLQDLTRPAGRIQVGAKVYGIDVVELQREIKDTLKTSPVVQAAIAATPPAPAAKPARKPREKMTVDEFNTKLAANLREAGTPNAFAPGDRVRIRTDVTRGVDTFHTRGMTGEIVDRIGDRKWLVKPDDLNMPLTIDYTEIDAL